MNHTQAILIADGFGKLADRARTLSDDHPTLVAIENAGWNDAETNEMTPPEWVSTAVAAVFLSGQDTDYVLEFIQALATVEKSDREKE